MNIKRAVYGRTWRWVLGWCSVIVATVVIFAIWFTFVTPALSIRANQASYDLVEIGASEQDVINHMGKPTRINRGNDLYVWEGQGPNRTPPVEGVEKEVWYTVRTFYLPVSHVFGIDDQGNVITKAVVD